MWSCPVCGKESNGVLCAFCGFDTSRDYEHYPTLQKLKGRPDAISRFKKKVKDNESVDEQLGLLYGLDLNDIVPESADSTIQKSQLQDFTEPEKQEVPQKTEKKSRARRVANIIIPLILLAFWVSLWGQTFLAGIAHSNVAIGYLHAEARAHVIEINDTIYDILDVPTSKNGFIILPNGVILSCSADYAKQDGGYHAAVMCAVLFVIPCVVLLSESICALHSSRENCLTESGKSKQSAILRKSVKICLITAVFVLWYSSMVEILISRFIHGGMTVGAKWEAARSILIPINHTLAELINAKVMSSGIYCLESGILLSTDLRDYALRNGICVMILCLVTSVAPIVQYIRKMICTIREK